MTMWLRPHRATVQSRDEAPESASSVSRDPPPLCRHRNDSPVPSGRPCLRPVRPGGNEPARLTPCLLLPILPPVAPRSHVRDEYDRFLGMRRFTREDPIRGLRTRMLPVGGFRMPCSNSLPLHELRCPIGSTRERHRRRQPVHPDPPPGISRTSGCRHSRRRLPPVRDSRNAPAHHRPPCPGTPSCACPAVRSTGPAGGSPRAQESRTPGCSTSRKAARSLHRQGTGGVPLVR